MSVKLPKLSEVTMTHLVCTDTREHAQEHVLRHCDGFYQAVTAREIQDFDDVSEEAVTHLHPDQDNAGEEDIPL